MDKEREQMTDEQIEKALKERAYQVTYGDKNDRWIIPKDKLSQETLAYIERLKEACNSSVRSFTRMETLYKLKCNELETVKAKAMREIAEKVKERLEQYRLKNEEQTESGEWQLDSCEFCIDVVCNGGLIDELLAEVTGE